MADDLEIALRSTFAAGGFDALKAALAQSVPAIQKEREETAKLAEVGKAAERALGELGVSVGEYSKHLKASTSTTSEFWGELSKGVGVGAGFSIAQKGAELLLDTLKSAPEALKAWVEAGSRIDDLATKIGASRTALQEWDFAAKLVGSTGEQVGQAVLRMSKNIAEGGTQTRKTLGDLNLNIAELQAMKPEEQFRVVAAALAAISDTGRQTADTFHLMGRSAEVLKVIRSDFEGVAEEAHNLGGVMSDKTIAAADRLGDAGTKLDTAWTGLKNTWAASVEKNYQLASTMENLAVIVARQNKATDDGTTSWGAHAAKLLFLATPLGLAVKYYEQLAKNIEVVANVLPKVNANLPVWKPIAPAAAIDFQALTNLVIAQGAAQEKEAEKTQRGIVTAAKKATEEQKLLAEARFAFEIDAFKRGQKASADYWKEQTRLANDYGKNMLGVVREFNKLEDAMTQSTMTGAQKRQAALDKEYQDQLFKISQLGIKDAAVKAQMVANAKAAYTSSTLAAKGYYATAEQFAEENGITFKAQIDENATAFKAGLDQMYAAGLITKGKLDELWERYKEKTVGTTQSQMAAISAEYDKIAGTVKGVISGIFGHSKGAAYATAVIDAAAAVLKTLAAYPWPWSLIPAAAVAVAGAFQISQIKNQQFRQGTPGLGFQDFGAETPALLHGIEAVVPIDRAADFAAMHFVPPTGSSSPASSSPASSSFGGRQMVTITEIHHHHVHLDAQVVGESVAKRMRQGFVPVPR